MSVVLQRHITLALIAYFIAQRPAGLPAACNRSRLCFTTSTVFNYTECELVATQLRKVTYRGQFRPCSRDTSAPIIHTH